jgi:hypothetical protein
VAALLDGKAPAVYVTLNRIQPALLARAHNRLIDHATVTTSDAEIVRRRWLLFDVDPVRPTGISATEAEHEAALAQTGEMRSFLTALGWPEPIQGDSGNGVHLLYPIDLPNDDTARQLVERVLRVLALGQDDQGDPAAPRVSLDTTVGNAARICKLYPTRVLKGDHLPERPHRRSRLLAAPERLEPVTRAQLEEVCELLGPAEPAHHATTGSRTAPGRVTDVGAYLREHGIAIRGESQMREARRWVLAACVWNPEHTDHSAFVLQFANGRIVAGCSHHSRAGKR